MGLICLLLSFIDTACSTYNVYDSVCSGKSLIVVAG
jgi:hypothetical protein